MASTLLLTGADEFTPDRYQAGQLLVGIGRSGDRADHYLHQLFPGIAGKGVGCVFLTWLNRQS